MALANKGHMHNDSNMAIIQASAFYEHNFGTNSPSEIYAIDDHPKIIYQDSDSPKKVTGSSESSPSSTNSSGIGYQYEGNSVISFKPQYNHHIHGNGSLLSFEQNNKRVERNLFSVNNDEEYPFWEEDLHSHITTTNHVPDTSISHHATIVYAMPNNGTNFAWPNDQEGGMSVVGIDQELGRREESNNKRPSTGETAQVSKKQCVVGSSSATKKQPKPKCASPISKDPQSMSAKNRRERISERLKILQDLVPNGSKVDLVTMLEKAIGYVKFLQLQVKVLATDEFWPAQGGKASDLTQVKEAIDAILASSQRDRNSSSK